MKRQFGSSFLTNECISSSNDDSSDSLAQRIHVIERLEHLLVIRLCSHIQDEPITGISIHKCDDDASVLSRRAETQPHAEFIDRIIVSKPYDYAKIRCVCLPDHEHACVLLQLYLEKTKPLDHFCDAPMLEMLQEEMYTRLSRAEIPVLSQISLFLSIYATSARCRTANDQKTTCSRYWQMAALYILTELGQAISHESVEVLQAILNILLLMQQQSESCETLRLLHGLCTSLGSEPPVTIEEELISTVDPRTRRRFRCQIERLSL